MRCRDVNALMLLVDGTHELRGWWQYLIDEDEDRLLWRKLDSLSDNVHKLSDRQVLKR